VRILGYVLQALSILAWGFLLWAGCVGLAGITGQHVPGYPSLAQITYYAGVPAMLLATGLAAASLIAFGPAALSHWLARPSRWFAFVNLLGLLPYLFLYGGGV
jgi:hypothetical protein